MKFIVAVMALLGIIAGGAFGARGTVAAQVEKSQWDGVYAQEQAKRGDELYFRNCAGCHAPDLTGGETAPALAGGEFAANWDALTVGDIFDRIRISMPQGNPGAINRTQKADVLAFILFKGGYPAGQEELFGQTEVLKTIAFLAQKPAK